MALREDKALKHVSIHLRGWPRGLGSVCRWKKKSALNLECDHRCTLARRHEMIHLAHAARLDRTNPQNSSNPALA